MVVNIDLTYVDENIINNIINKINQFEDNEVELNIFTSKYVNIFNKYEYLFEYGYNIFILNNMNYLIDKLANIDKSLILDISKIEFDISYLNNFNLNNIKYLKILLNDDNTFINSMNIISNLPNLEMLYLNILRQNESNIDTIKNLKLLYKSNNENNDNNKFKKLHTLDIYIFNPFITDINEIININNITNLKSLVIHSNTINKLPMLDNLTSLEYVKIFGLNINNLDNLLFYPRSINNIRLSLSKYCDITPIINNNNFNDNFDIYRNNKNMIKIIKLCDDDKNDDNMIDDCD